MWWFGGITHGIQSFEQTVKDPNHGKKQVESSSHGDFLAMILSF